MPWSVVLHSAPESPHVGRIEFANAKPGRGEFKCDASFEIDGESWGTSLAMIEPYRADMLAYFEELASGDWNGENVWESEFAEMRMTTELVDEALARIRVDMWWAGHDRTAAGELVVRRDELPRVGKEMSEFLRLDKGGRFGPGAYGRGRP